MIAGPEVPFGRATAYGPDLKAQAEALGVSARCHFIGPFPTIAELYTAADVTAVPSVVSEAFGRTVIESMACGTPVVASRVGGIPEILTGEFARHLFPAGDHHLLAERLNALHGWRELDPDLAARCRAHVEAHFDVAATIAGVEASLERTVAEWRSGAPVPTAAGPAFTPRRHAHLSDLLRPSVGQSASRQGADTLTERGHEVVVVTKRVDSWSDERDEELLASKPWSTVRIGLRRDDPSDHGRWRSTAVRSELALRAFRVFGAGRLAEEAYYRGFASCSRPRSTPERASSSRIRRARSRSRRGRRPPPASGSDSTARICSRRKRRTGCRIRSGAARFSISNDGTSRALRTSRPRRRRWPIISSPSMAFRRPRWSATCSRDPS